MTRKVFNFLTNFPSFQNLYVDSVELFYQDMHGEKKE